jgi:hypothetical protein
MHTLLELEVEVSTTIEVDTQVLDLLCRIVVDNVPDRGGVPGSSMERALTGLIERITQTKTNGEVWRIAGDFNLKLGRAAKAIDCFLAYCRVVQTQGWDTSKDQFKVVARAHVALGKALISGGTQENFSSARMKLRGLARKTEVHFGGTPEHDQIVALLEEIEVLLEK